MFCCFRTCFRRSKQSHSATSRARPTTARENIRLNTKSNHSSFTQSPKENELWQHTKTKNTYRITGVGKLQCKIAELDMVDCAIYVVNNPTDDQRPKIWIRPLCDFHDEDEESKTTRFTHVPDETASPKVLSCPKNYAQNADEEDWQVMGSEIDLKNDKKPEPSLVLQKYVY